MWYPFEGDNLLKYVLIQIQQIHFCVGTLTVMMACDALFFYIIILLSMKMNDICRKIENMIITGGETDLIQLKSLVSVHQKVLDFADKSSRTFSLAILFNCLVSTGVICLTFFQTSTADLPPIDFIRFFCFFFQQFCQIAMICVTGQLLIDSVSNSSLI